MVGMLPLLSGCTSLRLNARAARPVLLNTPQGEYQVVSHIEKKIGLCLDYTGTVDVSKAFVDQLTASENDAIINVSVTVSVTPGDFFLNLITLTLAQCRTAHVEGDVIRYNKPQ